MNNYLKIIDGHHAIWTKIFPEKADQGVDFFKGHNIDKSALDFSLNVLWDMLRRKGKKIRPVLMMLLADTYGINHLTALPLSYFVETVHNTTLIIDDIEDNSLSRRGEPCAHLKFGIDNTINAGELGFFLPAHNLLELEAFKSLDPALKFELFQIYIEEMKNLHLGLAWDIFWHSKRHTPETLPTEDNYMRMVESKTSVLIRIGFRMLAAIKNLNAEERKRIEKIANFVGSSFQIQDDIINLTSKSYSDNRGVGLGEDITEGKITLMVIDYVRKTKDQNFLDLLHSKTSDQSKIEKAIQSMTSSGSIDYARNRQVTIMEAAIQELDSLQPTNNFKEDMKSVLRDLQGRNV